MKTINTVISAAVASLMLSACFSTTPVVKHVAPPTPASASLYAPPATATVNIPSWYLQQPESTPEVIYVAGTALSRDMGMSNHKAQLDAETHLANKIAGEISTMTKDYKRDTNDDFAQNTEIVANKIAHDVKIIGGTVVDRKVFPEGGGFRTYVLLKFPVGNHNQMLQAYNNKKSFKAAKAAAEQEMEQRSQARRTREADDATPVEDNGGINIRHTSATDAKEEN